MLGSGPSRHGTRRLQVREEVRLRLKRGTSGCRCPPSPGRLSPAHWRPNVLSPAALITSVVAASNALPSSCHRSIHSATPPGGSATPGVGHRQRPPRCEWSPLDVLGCPRTRGAAPTPGTSCSCPRSSLSAAPPASAGIARTPPGSSPSNTLWPPRCRGIHGCCCPLTGRCGWCLGKHAALACDTALQGTAARECCCYCGPQRPCLPS